MQDRINYTQRVEFALKLGYTERLVQTALSRLGPNPNQNELLAELIKLSGAQTGSYNGEKHERNKFFFSFKNREFLC